MNELLIAILILLISFAMFETIILILKADKKVIELNDKVTEVKNIDFKKFEKVVSVVNKINNTIRLGTIKKIFEVVMTANTVFSTVIFIKKFSNKKKGEV